MAKTTTVTTSYTSNIVVNGTALSSVFVDGTQVRRCIVNGKDVIHKFTRTVVTASSDLTLIFDVHCTVSVTSLGFYTEYSFSSPIYADVTVTDNGSSGFTSITLITPILTFFCEAGTQVVDSKNCYQQQLTNQSLPIGQKTTLTFSDFNNKHIATPITSDFEQYTGYRLGFSVQDPDGIETSPYMLEASYQKEQYYWDTDSIHRVINKTLSDNTVQEY